MSEPPSYPDGFFDREDEQEDSIFYSVPRLVVHIDASTIDALTDAYRELLDEKNEVLDLMSSWVSHLPPEMSFPRVAGLGMNEAELEQNPRLHEFARQNLNLNPELPFPDSSFDAVLNAVSIQYLVRPVEVFQSAARILRPGGVHIIAFSHRCFPTKAIRGFRVLAPEERGRVVQTYFENAGGYEPPVFLDRSPHVGDPLWIVMARRA
jgi:SAM-dependent methyltransferase